MLELLNPKHYKIEGKLLKIQYRKNSTGLKEESEIFIYSSN